MIAQWGAQQRSPKVRRGNAMRYVVSFKTRKNFVTWRSPVETLEEAIELANEVWRNEVDKEPWVDVRIKKEKEK